MLSRSAYCCSERALKLFPVVMQAEETLAHLSSHIDRESPQSEMKKVCAT